jgi:hypothetical protein
MELIFLFEMYSQFSVASLCCRRLISHENFTRFARFGLIDQALLFVGFGLGFKADKFITKRIGAAVIQQQTKKT